MDRFTGHWWAPGDGAVAVECYDEAKVQIVTRAAIGTDGTRTFEQRYPAAGTPNVAVSLWLVSPESAKLLALKHEIEQEHPRALVHVSATPGHHLGEMDLIVTATSGAGKRVLDISEVKPGCVITDVARPLDLSPEDVARRPDVLVIESGEIELPGDVRMKNIGLPHGVAYACMAETVVLALEGRYETYTVGRNIEWEKVKEIYRLGLKHGMRLAAMSGVNGVFTPEDLARVRELALERRVRQGLSVAQ